MRENTLAAFRKARALGSDAIEFDVRLTRDGVAVVHHDYYLDVDRRLPVFKVDSSELALPRLEDVVAEFGGHLGLEIELKGPDIALADAAVGILSRHRDVWDSIEITSFEPTTLARVHSLQEQLSTALLFPPSEPWMRGDVVAYAALNRALASQARVVHLSDDQMDEFVVGAIRTGGVDVHAHAVNDEDALRRAAALDIPWICTDLLEQALAFRGPRRPD